MVLLIRVLVIALRTLTLSIREPGQFYRQFCCHHPFTRFVHSSLLRQIREQIYRESFIRNVKILKYTNPDFPAFLRSIMQIKIRKRSTIIQTYSFIPGFDLISLDYPFHSSLIQKNHFHYDENSHDPPIFDIRCEIIKKNCFFHA